MIYAGSPGATASRKAGLPHANRSLADRSVFGQSMVCATPSGSRMARAATTSQLEFAQSDVTVDLSCGNLGEGDCRRAAAANAHARLVHEEAQEIEPHLRRDDRMEAHASGGAVAAERRDGQKARAVQSRGMASSADQRLPARRSVNHAEGRPCVLAKPDRNRPLIAAANEVERAVDGIDDPDARRTAGNAAPLFADDPVFGKGRLQAVTDEPLHLLVGGGDEIEMALRFDGQRRQAPEVRERDLARLDGNADDGIGVGGLEGGHRLDLDVAAVHGEVATGIEPMDEVGVRLGQEAGFGGVGRKLEADLEGRAPGDGDEVPANDAVHRPVDMAAQDANGRRPVGQHREEALRALDKRHRVERGKAGGEGRMMHGDKQRLRCPSRQTRLDPAQAFLGRP